MSATDPLVSVIVPVFNGEQHIVQCLESLTSQSYANVEIIVVNDGSTDETAQMLRHAEQRDSRITAVHCANGGVSRARNRGLDLIRGQWVLFVDADDMLSDRRLVEAVVLAGHDHPELICFGSTSEPMQPEAAHCPVHPGGRSLARHESQSRGATAGSLRRIVDSAEDHVLDGAALAEMVAAETLNALWDKAYRGDLIVDRGCRFAEGTKMGEDLLFNLQYVDAGTVLRKLPITGYFYRRDNAASATSRYLPQKHSDLMQVSDQLRSWARTMGAAELRGAADYIRAKNVVSCMRDLHHPDCDLSPRERRIAAGVYRSSTPRVKAYGIGTTRRAFGSLYNALGARALFHLTRLLAAS